MHSSTSIAMRFRKSIAVGFMRISPGEMVGNARGKPPGLQTPRLTASATCLRCALQWVSSDQELAIPITGRPSKARSLKPSARRYARCISPSRVRGPNQLRLRRACVAMLVVSSPGVHPVRIAHDILDRRASPCAWGGPAVAPYVMVSTLAESGRKVLRERPGWIRKVNADVERMGVGVIAQYALLGPYDFLSVIEAPDNATVSRVSVELGARGGAAGMTMAAIPLDEFIARLERGTSTKRGERKKR